MSESGGGRPEARGESYCQSAVLLGGEREGWRHRIKAGGGGERWGEGGMEAYDRQGEREVGRERAGGIGETGRDTGVERWGMEA